MKQSKTYSVRMTEDLSQKVEGIINSPNSRFDNVSDLIRFLVHEHLTKKDESEMARVKEATSNLRHKVVDLEGTLRSMNDILKGLK